MALAGDDDIDVPIILAGMGAGATSAEFAAAVSNQGGLGSVGSLFRTSDAVKRDIDALPTLTNRKFAINHIPQALDADAFRHTLEARPAVISFALADLGERQIRLRRQGTDGLSTHRWGKMDSNHRSLARTGRDAVQTPGLPRDGMRPGDQPATADAGPAGRGATHED